MFSSADWLESANYSVWERVVAKDSLIGSELSACGPGWIDLLPTDLILVAPVESNLFQRLSAKCEPSRFDPVPSKRSLEMPEGTCTLDGAQQFLSNAVGCSDLPFLLPPVNQVWLLLKGFVRLTQKRVDNVLEKDDGADSF
jgi:hypothetical protein